ncbi:MAG: WD domain-containing protein, G-beta repeat-containing protein [Candidatus Kentron sp. G]|nr:MAG: WD domain-containing protein, G-beta repeat-containing protein [Candidatus Kentron sp. G]VFN00251.1 MAG: WD domain-containing protein, G-beta repeat-containing protein [Candidatus Kentron sp. G]VFN03463.1 MAG: WD domain-containing protein, G-beta repeat-containing protein [Candidatus Kentron sp. G]
MKFQLPNLPTFPATPTGLESAIRAFLTEQGAPRPAADPAHTPTGNPPERLDVRVESLLGDALPWAQDCAMFQPAIPLGLADTLRRRFYPQLPPDRLGRFFALPDTLSTAAGIRFSTEVLAILHRGFNQRRGDAPEDGAAAVRANPRVRPPIPTQDAVLAFFEEEIDKAKPALKDGEKPGLAYLKWESIRERLRLESDADSDLKRLAELTDPASPLSDSLLAGLENYALEDDEPGNDPDKIPLRLAPKNPKARQRLAALAGNPFKIRKLAAFPLTHWQKTLLGVLVLSFVGLVGMGVVEYRAVGPVENFQLVGEVPGDYRLEAAPGDGARPWQEIEGASRRVGANVRANLVFAHSAHSTDHRLILYGNGHRTMEEFTTPDAGQGTRIHVKSRDESVPCREAFPEMGLTVMRCSVATASVGWGEPARANPNTQTQPTHPVGVRAERSPQPTPGTPGSAGLQAGKASSRQSMPGTSARDGNLLIALEFADGNTPELPTLPALREQLWQTGELDILYQVRPVPDGAGNPQWKTGEILAAMARDLAPWTENSRLLWWQAEDSITGPQFDTLALSSDGFARFAKAIQLPVGDERGLRVALTGIFDRDLPAESYPDPDYANWRALWKIQAHERPITYPNGIAFSPDGRTLLTGSYDTTMKLWDAASGKEIRTFTGHSNLVTSVAFSPDGRAVLSGSSDKTVKLWAVASGPKKEDQPIRTFSGHSGTVWSVAFAPDGRTVISGSDDKTVKLWAVASGQEIRTLTDTGDSHSNRVWSVAFSPDGRRAASGDYGGVLILWGKE